MSYLVIARKFRPQTFASVEGQEHISTALANAIVKNRVPHALLFTGPRGVGKTTSARIFAKALNCTGREVPESVAGDDAGVAREAVEPCGECVNCKEIAKSSSMAVWEIDGASNNSVDNVRELIDSLHSLPPPNSRYKIYIIDEVHMLSTAAFNALLKSLEEPPPNTIFIFATTEPHKIPDTVISRCQRHDFRRITTDVIAAHLASIGTAEGVTIDESVCQFIAEKANGGMRDAQSMLDRLLAFSQERITRELAQQVFGVVDRSYFRELSAAVLAQDTAQCFALLDTAFGQSIDLRTFVSDFVSHWRRLMLLALVSRRENVRGESLEKLLGIPATEIELLKEQLAGAVEFDLQRLFDIAEKAATGALTSSFPRYVLEAGVAKMATLPSLRPLPEILAALDGAAGQHPAQQHSAPGLAAANVVAKKKTAPAAEIAPKAPAVTPAVVPANVAVPEDLSAAAEESAPATESAIDLSAVAADSLGETEVVASPEPVESGNDFNPSWQDFVTHVKARSEHILAEFLRRVSAKSFSIGRLTIEAGEFDLKSLSDRETLMGLRSCLFSYSGHNDWDVQFLNREGEANAPEVDTSEGKRARTVENQALRPDAGPTPGSLVAQEVQKKSARSARIVKEAKNSPLVKEALGIFEGSAVEKVVVLKSSS